MSTEPGTAKMGNEGKTMKDIKDVFCTVNRWREGDILKASNDWISMAYVVTDDPRKVGKLGLYGPQKMCVEYISPEQGKLWDAP